MGRGRPVGLTTVGTKVNDRVWLLLADRTLLDSRRGTSVPRWLGAHRSPLKVRCVLRNPRRQACEYEDNTAEGDGGADGQCYLVAAHKRGAGSMREQGTGGAPGASGHGEGTAERAEDGLRGSCRQVPAGQRGGHVILVTSRQHAPDHSDPERAADLQRHGVGG